MFLLVLAVPSKACFVNSHPLVAIMADLNYNCADLSDGDLRL